MHGYQDKLFVQTHLQFYSHCIVSGTVNFIFGDAAVVLQSCLLVLRKSLTTRTAPSSMRRPPRVHPHCHPRLPHPGGVRPLRQPFPHQDVPRQAMEGACPNSYHGMHDR